MQRALTTAVQKLEAAGHRIVDLSGKVPSAAHAADVSFRIFQLDPDKTQLKNVASSGEPFIPSLRFTYNLEGRDPEPTLRGLFDLNAARGEIAAKMRRLYLDHQLDVIVGSGYQSCAVPHDTFGLPVYTVLANLVDVRISRGSPSVGC